mgnify:CR=1 FL=1
MNKDFMTQKSSIWAQLAEEAFQELGIVMGKNGKIAADTVFSWNHIADETLAVYRS